MRRKNEFYSIQALLRSRMRDNLDASIELLQAYQELDAKIGETADRTDEALERALALAEEMGLDAGAMRAQHERDMEKLCREQAAREKPPEGLRIVLPADFSFREEFARLSREAQEAGYTDVRIDDLLTQEEIVRVLEEEEDLDAQFARESRIELKDIGVMMAAVAVRLTLSRIHISVKEEKLKSEKEKQQREAPVLVGDGQSQQDELKISELPETNLLRQHIEKREAAAREAAKAEEEAAAQKAKEIESRKLLDKIFDMLKKPEENDGRQAAQGEQPQASVPSGPQISAGAGVDLGALRGAANLPAGNQPGGIQAGGMLTSLAMHKGPKRMSVRSGESILNEPVPFDISDNGYFSHKEIAGFDPFLGWVVGVINLLTHTVTTYRMKSYSVVKSAADQLRVDEELSTILHVILPVLTGGVNKDAIAAAVVKEAAVLGVANSSPEEVSRLYSNALTLEREQSRLTGLAAAAGGKLRKLGVPVIDTLGGFAEAALINTIVAAIHVISYDPQKDGDLKRYALRTQRILAYSSAIASAAANVTAILTKNVKLADFGSVIEALLRVFNYNRFWIDCKAEFLGSAYKQTIDAELERMEKYFIQE